ncbi:MAG: NAD(P)-dependent oxidoreductase [Verrucomicrobia bacterium]|nr:NAD(P)-dependent oxidoreductase [Verrucomicrobiota bacterium]
MVLTPDQPAVVLTGATGFIGSAVLAELLSQRRRTLVLLRPESNCRRIAPLSGYEGISYTHLGDAKLATQLRDFQPAVLIHCAWRGVAGNERDAAYQIAENLPFTLDSVKLAAACGCRQWIGLGSQAEYGNLNRVIAETAPTLPTTVYGKAKLAAGVAALALAEASGLHGAWVRVFSTYGPGDYPQWFIPYVIRELLQGKRPQLTRCDQIWDYLYVQDAARAIITLADGWTDGIFNLGSGMARPLRQVVEIIRRELDMPPEPEFGALPYRPDQVMHLQADISKLQQASRWFPLVSLEQGLRVTVDFYRQEITEARQVNANAMV